MARAALLYGALGIMASTQAQTPTAGPMPFGVDVPHIALLLPVDSSTFRYHAEALRDGFLAASRIPDPPTLLIRVYPVGEDTRQAVASYKLAVQTGARLVIGPLVRSAVTAVVAGDITVPTLVLNTPDGPLPHRPNLYLISLQIEAEARQIAQLAIREGHRSAFTVAGEGQLLRRLRQAFVDEFVKLGGRHSGDFRYNVSPAELARLYQAAESRTADMAFLALDARQARGVRPHLGPLTVYASSQAYIGESQPSAAIDLAGVRLLDIPWLLQRDHPAVMIYPRLDYRGDADLQRLYALGIDAWRIGQALLARHTHIALDGVTGKLTLGPDRQFERELSSARMGENVPAAPIGPVPSLIVPAPAKPALSAKP